MLWRRFTLLGALLAVLPPVQAFLDPFTLTGFGIGTAALALYAELENSMMNHVFGQHLVIDIVVKALRGHFYRGHPSKALAMSFHGWPGGGKNYVSQFITNSLYAKGSRSRFVHFFAGKLHFPLQEQADIYRKLKGRFSSVFACPDQTEPICRLFQLHLQDWIRGNVSQCYWSTFIFDEVDKMPRGVLDAVKPFIDHHDHIDGVEYRHAIFIFLSNTGGNTITKRHLELWQSGKRREDFELRDFEDLIRKGAFNEAGGFHKSEAIESNLIDHYVPFLPLEEKHVRLCVIEEFKKRGVMNPQEELVDEIMKDVTFGPNKQRIFSNSGCKRLSHKVLTLIERLKYRDMTEEDMHFYTRR
uniref:Torsin-1A C-terminal domain-containing protein n=2 Tax=Timema TaxID=61471 RepID=A0A7R9I6E0_9NEOP|nr:unnamed protein product [Timema bartmani]